MICVSIGRTRHKMVVAEHQALADKGAELIELRVDWLQRAPDVVRLLKDRPTPVIVTCRRQADRGRWRGSEEQRQVLLRTAIVTGAEYVDLEEDIAGKIPRYGKTRRIISHHDFEKTPDDLEAIHQRLCKHDPDIVKLVTMANSPRDPVRMLRLVANAKVPTVGFCMGELGQLSRILCGKYGSPFTYATFSRERELAPGQIAFSDMRKIYHYDAINRDTKVYGVLGDPIGHSLSPLVHNTAFRHEGLNCVYLPFRVPKDKLKKTLKAFEWLEVQGYSVTIPHKEEVFTLAECDEPTVKIGAANTLFRGEDGKWRGTNTDYQAALDALEAGLNPGDNLIGKRVLLLGAGGVARAIGLGIMRNGGALTLTNRSSERGKALAEQIGCRYVSWENRGSEYADILMNCTSLGMYPNVNETPFQSNWLRDDMLVFDTVYNPENTLLLKEARQHNCRVVSGLEMFVRQAAAQFQLFTNRPAPLDLMTETVRRGISAVNY